MIPEAGVLLQKHTKMMKLAIAITLSLVALSYEYNCGVPQVQTGRVVGGTDAKKGAWPWQILMLEKGKNAGCGGTLISSKWVVTAAHCVDSSNLVASNIQVRVGVHDYNVLDGSELHDVERVIPHPNWSRRTGDFDIALFKLSKPVKFNKLVQPACLPTRVLKPGTECYITGWGKTNKPGPRTSILQQAMLPIVDSRTCSAKNKRWIRFKVTSRMLCAGDGGRTSKSGCRGDSGGPFVCKVKGKWELHGDVSYGSRTCNSQAYTVFGRTTYFYKWIMQTVRKY